MRKISISPAEWAVMQALWERSPATVGEILSALPEERRCSHQILRTMLLRLEKKGAVQVDKSGAHFLYAPLASREDCVGAETESFLSRVFDGSAAGLVLSLAQSGRLSKRDRAEILKIIESMGEDA